MKNKILIPLNALIRGKLQDLFDAGADEFYMGFYEEEWTQTFGAYSEINRMSGFGKRANPYGISEIKEIARELKEAGKSLYVTLNAAAYTKAEEEKLNEYLDVFRTYGVDGVIVSTPELAKNALSRGVDVVASTMCGVYNRDIAAYYRDLGVKRIILPRDLTLKEIESIVNAVPDVEFEVFLMRNGCQFSDSHCLGFHRERGSVCGMLNGGAIEIVAKKGTFSERHETELNNLLYTSCFHKVTACGLCALYRFVKLGVAAYKIVGRSENPDGIIEDVKTVKKNIKIASSCSSEEEYLEKMLLPENSRMVCKLGLNCYYPELRFKG